MDAWRSLTKIRVKWEKEQMRERQVVVTIVMVMMKVILDGVDSGIDSGNCIYPNAIVYKRCEN